MPILRSTDVDTCVAFYENGLGFSCAGKWKNDDGETDFAIIKMDQITIGLQNGKPVDLSDNWVAYFYVADIAAYRDQIQSNAIPLHRDLKEQFYGCRDLEVRDPAGNILCFGQDMSPKPNGPGL